MTLSLPALLLLAATAVVWADDEDKPLKPAEVAGAIEGIDVVGDEFRKLGDWSTQFELIDASLDEVWSHNKWTSEPDEYAKRIAREVARIPPWEFEQRMEKFTGLVGDRYDLTPEQRIRFQGKVYRETFGLVARNAAVITRQTSEFVSARQKNQPITREQVARWTRESEPLMADFQERIDRITESLRREMSPEQRRILERDYRSMQRRMEDIVRQRAEWASGQWDPQEWGLGNDPIQSGKTRRPGGTESPPAGSAPAAVPPQPGVVESEVDPPVQPWAADDETTWERYVRSFIARYQLDPGQRAALWSILSEMEQRARQYRQSRNAGEKEVPTEADPAAPEDDTIGRMFQELQSRAEALLTTPQRFGKLSDQGPRAPALPPPG